MFIAGVRYDEKKTLMAVAGFYNIRLLPNRYLAPPFAERMAIEGVMVVTSVGIPIGMIRPPERTKR
jgi:hypothetical protein